MWYRSRSLHQDITRTQCPMSVMAEAADSLTAKVTFAPHFTLVAPNTRRTHLRKGAEPDSLSSAPPYTPLAVYSAHWLDPLDTGAPGRGKTSDTSLNFQSSLESSTSPVSSCPGAWTAEAADFSSSRSPCRFRSDAAAQPEVLDALFAFQLALSFCSWSFCPPGAEEHSKGRQNPSKYQVAKSIGTFSR